MKRIFVLGVLLLSFAFALDSNEEQNVMQGLREDENFSTLVSLLEEAELDDDLETMMGITLLAPSNAAFEAVDPQALVTLSGNSEALLDVLNLHVIKGSYSVLDLGNSEEGAVVSLSGSPYVLEKTATGLTVDGVSLTATDVDNVYSNGTIQVVDRVLGVDTTADAETLPEVMFVDTNGDGVLDDSDIVDMNADGLFDSADLALMGVGDTNNDGMIDVSDINDVNGDGVIDQMDRKE